MNNIYDNLFNIYLNYRKKCSFGYDTPKEYIFLNTMETQFENYDEFQNFANELHDLLQASNKEYFIAGIKTALELLKH